MLIFFFAGSAWAEVVYVNDFLRLGVRPSPDPAEASIAVVTTGDALTVLGREGDYIQIRTEDGTEGWVSQAYVSEEPPARLKLEQLREEYAGTQAQTNVLRNALAESNESRAAMEERLAGLTAENASLQQQVEQLSGSTAGFMRKYAWVFQSATAIALFLAGFYLGALWYRRRVRKRLGGMEI